MESGSHNKITRKLLVALMEWLSKITISRTNDRIFYVPVQYCSHQKFLQIMKSSSARKNMDLDNNTSPVEQQWILPRISTNLTGIVFDTTRHINKTNMITDTYAPVPYNLEIEVSSITKTLDDAFQIMETIIPYFSPSLSIDVKIYDDNSESIPITLNNLSYEYPTEIDEFSERLYITSFYFTIRANYYRQPKPLNRITNPTLISNTLIDLNGNPIDANGNLIEVGVNQNGNPVNKNGLPIVYGVDKNGNLIDKYGNYVIGGLDSAGFLLDVYGNKIVGDDGKFIKGQYIDGRMYYNGVEIFVLYDNLKRLVVGGVDKFGNPVDNKGRKIIGGLRFHIDYDETIFEQYVLNASNPYPILKQGANYNTPTSITLKKRGTWNSDVLYNIQDAVLYNGSWFVWINSESNYGIEPGTTDWQKYWTPLSVIARQSIEFSNEMLITKLNESETGITFSII